MKRFRNIFKNKKETEELQKIEDSSVPVLFATELGICLRYTEDGHPEDGNSGSSSNVNYSTVGKYKFKFCDLYEEENDEEVKFSKITDSIAKKPQISINDSLHEFGVSYEENNIQQLKDNKKSKTVHFAASMVDDKQKK